MLELTLFLSASQQKGWLGQMGCHNFIDLRKRAKLDIIAIKSDSTSFENPCTQANDRHSKLNGISRSHLHAQLIKFLGKKKLKLLTRNFSIFSKPLVIGCKICLGSYARQRNSIDFHVQNTTYARSHVTKSQTLKLVRKDIKLLMLIRFR